MRCISFFFLAAGSAGLYLVFSGCSQPAPSAPPPTADPFCAALAEPFCEALYACCVDGRKLDLFRAGLSVDECKQNWSHGVCLPPEIKDEIDFLLSDGYTVYNPAKLDACVAHLLPLKAGGYACVAPPMEVLMMECLSAFEGQSPPGEYCFWDTRLDDINSFMVCKDGICVDKECVPFLKTGDACPTGPFPGNVPLSETCNYTHGEWCMGLGDTGTCGPRGELGAACIPEFSAMCRSVICDGTTGTCIPSATPTMDSLGCLDQ